MLGRLLRLATLGATVSLFGLLMLNATGSAAVPVNVDVYGDTGKSAGVHAIGYTQAFTNFASGAVDNRYPLAAVKQDSGPSSYATASSQDYGPLGATLAASGTPRVDYAVAQYPPTGQAAADATCCDNTGHSEAHARELTSNANGVYSGSQQGTGAPSFQNATADGKTILNIDGSLVITMHAHVDQADFGGSAGLVIKNVDVIAKITSANGTAKVTTTIAPGSATFAGQPVSITDQGTTVGGTTLPSLGTSVATPVFRVFTVKPDSTVKGNAASVDATGTHVVVSQPSAPGVPANQVEYVLGETHAEGFLQPAQPTAAPVTSDLSALGSLLNSAPVSTGVPPELSAAPPSGIYQTPAPAPKKVLPRYVLLAANRAPVAPLFFLWEALVLGSAASIVWARRKPPVGEDVGA